MKTNPTDIFVHGNTVDEHSRCVHYHSGPDIIAIKFKCCNQYYACFFCHEKVANHPPEVWKKNEFDEKAILCGECYKEMSVTEYLNSGNQCIFCHSKFNPNCNSHYHYYFEI